MKHAALYKNNSLTYVLAKRLIESLDNSDDQELFFFTINLLGKAMSEGHVCLDMNIYEQQEALKECGVEYVFPAIDEWMQRLNDLPFVNSEEQSYFVLQYDRLYLDKYAFFEQQLATMLMAKSHLHRFFEPPSVRVDGEIDWQSIAANNAVMKPLNIVVGGPGTGKTTTVIKILEKILLHEGHGEYKVAMSAPTGKAAARLLEAVSEKISQSSLDESLKQCLPEQAQTLHRLLGYSRKRRSFFYNEENVLPLDCLIVDEVSMVDMAMFCSLLRAVPEDCRLIMLGDPYQLASVQAGNVLSEICQNAALLHYSSGQAGFLGLGDDHVLFQSLPLMDNMTLLRKSYRFADDKGIGLFANALLQQDANALDRSLGEDEVCFFESENLTCESEFFEQTFEHFKSIKQQESVASAFRQMARFQLLCATKAGRYSTQYYNELFYQNINFTQGLYEKPVYQAMPVMMLENNYSHDLYNGDMGIVWPVDDKLYLFFPDSEGGFRQFLPGQLPGWQCAHAITVHKSQGSEYDHVALALPSLHSPLLTREMLYTAVTRAKKRFDCLGTRAQLHSAMQQHSQRHSGLSQRLHQFEEGC